ncbi:MAG: signal peptidase I [Chloroflexi bacterium]|nr:signal peptidase I [Chloroflexota bacterium]
MFVLLFLIVFGLMQLSLQSFRVEGHSMEPSFHNSQYLVVDKLRYRFVSPRRGDVIVFRNPQSPDSPPLIKRVVGLPGETVEIKGGYIYIDGVLLKETPSFDPLPYSGYQPTTVPPGYYYVVGDNRTSTTGSQIFGPVPKENIIGRVWLSYWPLSEWGLSPTYAAVPQVS